MDFNIAPDIADLLSTPVALFLDFDGTLVEIAPTPGQVKLTEERRETLARLSDRLEGALAIISGRDLADLDRLLRPLQIATAGAHGSTVRNRRGVIKVVHTDDRQIADAAKRAEAFCDARPGLLCEVKHGAVAIHFRGAPELERECRVFADALLKSKPSLELISGKMVLEIKLAGASKGEALAVLMEDPPFHGRRPIFVGDDTTDETAFAEVNRRDGVSIKIGSGPTIANHRVAGYDEFTHWLEAFAAAAGRNA